MVTCCAECRLVTFMRGNSTRGGAAMKAKSILRFAAGLMFAVCAFVWVVTPASAVVFNLATEWSDSSNPSGQWTYREGNNPLPSVADWTWVNAGGIAQPAWAPSNTGGNYLPAWFKVTEVAFDFQIGDVIVHTTDFANGGSSGIANLLFTSPISGVADISGAIWNARNTLSRAQRWELRVDGILVDSGLLPGNGTVTKASPDAINLSNISLDLSDLIILSIFVDASNTSLLGDFIGVSLNIDITPNTNVVPLPAAFPLFAGGLGALGLLGWRRKRKVQATTA